MPSSGCLPSSPSIDDTPTVWEHLGPMKLIKEIINPQQRVLVLNGDFVQFSVINTQSLATILFVCQQHWCSQGKVLGPIRPLLEYSNSCSFNIANSVGAIRYSALEMGVVPGIMSIENSTTLSGGSSDISSNTFRNSFHTDTSSSYLQQWHNPVDSPSWGTCTLHWTETPVGVKFWRSPSYSDSRSLHDTC